MAKNAHRTTIICFFTCFWLFAFAALFPVYGGGSRDISLSKADELIENKEYDQAIQLLTEYARKNPNEFDQTQARLNQIYQYREDFNRIADRLIETLLEKPEEAELILTLTQTLKSMENENSPVLVDFLNRTHEIALFNVSRLRLRRILENGREMLDRGNYESALQIYAGGFEIMRDEFYSENYGAQVHNQTRQETERVNAVIANFRGTAGQLESITSELTRAVNARQSARIPDIIARFTPVIDSYIAEKNNIYSSAAVFESHLQNIQRANPAMGDRNHLAFVTRVIYGRSEADIQEGILGAFDGFWKRSAGTSLDAVTQYFETANSAGLNLFTRRDYIGAVNTLADMPAYMQIIHVFSEKERQLTRATAAQTVVFNDVIIQRNGLSQFLKITSLYEANQALRQAAMIPGREQYDRNTLANLRSRRITAPEALAIEQRTRSILNAQKSEIQEIREKAVQADAQISEHQNFPYIKNAVSAIDALFNSINTEEQQSAQRYYNIAQSDLEYSIAQIKTQFDKARSYIEGNSRNPSMAMQELSPMLDTANEEIIRGNTLLAQLRDEPPGIASNNEIRNLSTRYQASVNELTAIRDQGQTMLDSAGGRAAQAEALRREGERLFTEAQTAFQRRDYETSVNRIQSATQRLDESLVLQESEPVREFRDTRLLELSRQIAMAQNEAIIIEVRNLVDAARDLYFAGNFQIAEDNLLRAQNRWRIINAAEENPEVVLWLGMVNRAMTASSARVVPPTAPLYPEISQLLNQARRNYEEGIRLINAGQRSEGIAKFDEARVQTREVKLMFPVNQEAGVLELRMEQFTDPRAFNAAFEQRLQTARAGTLRRSLEAYGDLLNLAEINPNYPGIRNIITQAEIDMGIRPPPPNPADIARSRELTASANRILEQRLISEFPSALIQINEAIALNPLNTDAPRIKDRLLNMSNTTETSAIVLSSEDEALYQQAFSDYTARNYLVAYSNIQRILQNPRNRNVTKVIELQRRIQAAL